MSTSDDEKDPRVVDPTEEQPEPEPEPEVEAAEDVVAALAEIATDELPKNPVDRCGPRWEFMVFQGGAAPLAKPHLDQFGSQGWQLASVCVLHIGPMPIVNYYFQRPIYDS